MKTRGFEPIINENTKILLQYGVKNIRKEVNDIKLKYFSCTLIYIRRRAWFIMNLHFN